METKRNYLLLVLKGIKGIENEVKKKKNRGIQAGSFLSVSRIIGFVF